MYNSIQIEGNVGKNPELITTKSQNKVVEFRLANNRGVKGDSGEYQNKAHWFTVQAWNKTAEFCQSEISKGSRILVMGRVESERWEDKNGKPHETIKIIASDIRKIAAKDKNELETVL